jgi:hypothetical protein
MRIRILVLWVAACGTLFTTVTADEPAKPLPIGSVYGNVVDTKDIGLTETIDTSVEFDSRDSEHWEQMGPNHGAIRLLQAVWRTCTLGSTLLVLEFSWGKRNRRIAWHA